METIDSRRLLGGILCGALAAAGLALTPGAAEAQVVVVARVTATPGITPTIGGAPSAVGFAGGIEVGASAAGDNPRSGSEHDGR